MSIFKDFKKSWNTGKLFLFRSRINLFLFDATKSIRDRKYVLSKWYWGMKFRAIRGKLKHKIYGGYKCHSCGTIMKFDGSEITGIVNGKRMLFSNHPTKNRCFCSHCLYDMIHDYFENAKGLLIEEYDDSMRSPIQISKCDFMGVEAPTIDGIFESVDSDLNIRFGREWWNGFRASEEAFRILLKETGEYKTSFMNYKNGKSWYVTRFSEVESAQKVTEVQQRKK